MVHHIMSKLGSLLKKSGAYGTSVATFSENPPIKKVFADGHTPRNQNLPPTTPDSLFPCAGTLGHFLGAGFILGLLQEQKIGLETHLSKLFNDQDHSSLLFPTVLGHQFHLRNEMQIRDLLAIPFIHDPAFFSENGREHDDQPWIDQLNQSQTREPDFGRITPMFRYKSFLLRQLLERRVEGDRDDLFKNYLSKLGNGITGSHLLISDRLESNFSSTIPSHSLLVPKLQATPLAFATFIRELVNAYHHLDGSALFSHNTAVCMLHPDRRTHTKNTMLLKLGLGISIGQFGKYHIGFLTSSTKNFHWYCAFHFRGPNKGEGLVAVSAGAKNAIDLNLMIAKELMDVWLDKGDRNTQSRLNQKPETKRSSQTFTNSQHTQTADLNPIFPIKRKSVSHQQPHFTHGAVGASVMICSDESFAEASNLFSPWEPVFDPNDYGNEGKTMDSWESARHSPEGQESVIFKLNHETVTTFVFVSTKYHDGNHCSHFSLDIWDKTQGKWVTLLSNEVLAGHSCHWYRVNWKKPILYGKLIGYPDGGISRLGLYQGTEKEMPTEISSLKSSEKYCSRYQTSIPQSQPIYQVETSPDRKTIEQNWERLANSQGEIFNAASLSLGAQVISSSDEHYGPAERALADENPKNMSDGFESKRSRHKELEWINISLYRPLSIEFVEFDFSHFLHNSPRDIEVLGIDETGKEMTVIEKTYVKPWRGNRLRLICKPVMTKNLRIQVYPDGGFNRFRAYAKKRNIVEGNHESYQQKFN